MSVRQFAQSLGLIRRAEDHSRSVALARHIMWQGRKLLFPRPVHLRLSQSVISDDEPGGVISMVNMFGCYDYNNMNLIQTLLATIPASIDPVFIDVGANIGAYTLIASEVPGATVVSLEPIPPAFKKLQENVRLNDRPRVTTLNVAASRVPGELRMTAHGCSSLNHVVADASPQQTVTIVPADTIDAICERLALTPAVIKIDVEGHEPAVLEGAGAALASCQSCLVENGDRPEIVALMHDHGMLGPYHYRHRQRSMLRTPQPLAEDQIFLGRRFAANFPNITVESP